MANLVIQLGHRRRLQREIARRLGHPAKEPLFILRGCVSQPRELPRMGNSTTKAKQQKVKCITRASRNRYAEERPDSNFDTNFLLNDSRVSNFCSTSAIKPIENRRSYIPNELDKKKVESVTAQIARYSSALTQYHQIAAYRICRTIEPRQSRDAASIERIIVLDINSEKNVDNNPLRGVDISHYNKIYLYAVSERTSKTIRDSYSY